MAAGKVELSFEDFLEKQRDDESRIVTHVYDSYKSVVKDCLNELHLHTSKDQANQQNALVDQLLVGTASCLINIASSPQEKPASCMWDIISNACEEYQGLYETSFLLLSAPRESQSLSPDEEKQARQLQLDKFYQICTDGKDANKFPSMPGIVETYKDTLDFVKDFFKCLAYRSKRVFIVFNGHGTREGNISLYKEQQPISNTAFLKDIYNIWEETKTQAGEGSQKVLLPANITVIFAQCFSHRYCQSPRQREVIEVVSLATPRAPETYSIVYWSQDARRQIVDSDHLQLNEFARENQDGVAPDASDTRHPPEPDWNSYGNVSRTMVAVLLGNSLDRISRLDKS